MTAFCVELNLLFQLPGATSRNKVLHRAEFGDVKAVKHPSGRNQEGIREVELERNVFISDLSHVPGEILKMVSLIEQLNCDVGSIYGLVLRQIGVRFTELELQETTTGHFRKLQIWASLFLCCGFIRGALNF